jgi:hypothetical protein
MFMYVCIDQKYVIGKKNRNKEGRLFFAPFYNKLIEVESVYYYTC